ncbi:MAG: transcription antitermination factor NusB [Verrucomicrobiota bacterium]|nr:transcription antitermination factor NusB [Verrucomicrobiota bacterium]
MNSVKPSGATTKQLPHSSPKPSANEPAARTSEGWLEAVETLAIWLHEPQKADDLIDAVATEAGIKGFARNRQQALVFGVLRHKTTLETELNKWISRPPRPKSWATLLVAVFQLAEAESDEQRAKIVHHAVEQMKKILSTPELGLVNAVLRKVAGSDGVTTLLTPGIKTAETAVSIARNFSHPKWLVKRWLDNHGRDATLALLAWNQQASPTYLHWLSDEKPTFTEALAPSQWANYYSINHEGWPQARKALTEGKAIVQDPFARIPVDLLGIRPGQSVLDLCAAPGGKSRLLASRLAGDPLSLLVSVDLPGKRVEMLLQSMTHANGIKSNVLGADVRTMNADTFTSRNLPVEYDAVLLDAPCSNTGVIRRRPDVKWRLTPKAVTEIAMIQQELLKNAASFVRMGGLLAYSTCSLEKEENEAIVDAFLQSTQGAFVLKGSQASQPWRDGHDGGGAFVLERVR